MTELKLVLADDEPLAIERLEDMLLDVPDVTVVGVATTGDEAISLVLEHQPDVLLLDVDMPRRDGFDVVEALARAVEGSASVPLVILVTAYPQFAVQAYDHGAVDFLTKPVRVSRLEQALSRARAALSARDAEARLALLSVTLDELRASRDVREEDRALWIHRGSEMVRVEKDDIRWVQAEGEYVRLHVKDRSYLHRELLGQLADKLDPARFIRVHRSFLVRRDCVTVVSRNRWGNLRLHLEANEEIPVGRKFAAAAAVIFRHTAPERARGA